MTDAYPFHPALIGLMRERWAAIPDFQRTRGALRFLAACLHAVKRGARQALPLLREILKTKGWRSKEYPRPYVNNRCLHEEVAKAIKQLEAVRGGMGGPAR